MKKLRFLVVVVLLFPFCTRDYSEVEPSIPDSEEKQNYAISPKEALTELDRFLTQIGRPVTRSPGMQVFSIEPILSNNSHGLTRSGCTLSDTLFYLVNFDDSMGFALLAADKRMEYPIYAVAEKGRLSVADFYPQDPPLGRPLTREEVTFLNDSLDDGLSTDYPDFPTMFRNIIAPGAENRALSFRPYDKDGDTQDQRPPGGGGGRQGPGPWETFEKYGPFLYTKWEQGDPYNKYCPVRGDDPAPAGCVAIAIGQIANYNCYPDYIADTRVFWEYANMLGNNNYDSLSGIDYFLAVYYAATAIRAIGHLCSMDYGVQNSSSNTSKAKDCFKSMGYGGVEKYNSYHQSVVQRMIYGHKPVYIAGKRKWVNVGHGSGGHAWVIDGLLKRKRNNNGRYEQQELVHCNFGWPSGAGNGYYEGGIFNTGAPIMYDPVDDQTTVTNPPTYKCHFRLLEYDQP